MSSIEKKALDTFSKELFKTVEDEMVKELNREDDPTILDSNFVLLDNPSMIDSEVDELNFSQAYYIRLTVFGNRAVENYVSNLVRSACDEYILDDETYYMVKRGLGENPPEGLSEAFYREIEVFILPRNGVEFEN